jgi:hypothetical protein
MECIMIILIDPYQPCVSACVSLPSSTCAYDGCRSSLRGGCTFTMPPLVGLKPMAPGFWLELPALPLLVTISERGESIVRLVVGATRWCSEE